MWNNSTPVCWWAVFFLGRPKKAGLQWSFSKRDYCRTGQSRAGAKLEKRDCRSAKKKRDYCSRKTGTIRQTQSVLHQQIGVLLYHIIFISLYYTHYDTIIFHYDTIISLIFLQMSRLLFFIISIAPKGLLFHLWHFYYFTYFFPHWLLLLLLLSHYYLHYLYLKLLFLLSFSVTIILLICFRIYYIYYYYYHTIMCIIFISNHYYYYFFRNVLCRLFVFVSIILIMTIITLLFALCLCLTIITIMAFQFY